MPAANRSLVSRKSVLLTRVRRKKKKLCSKRELVQREEIRREQRRQRLKRWWRRHAFIVKLARSLQIPIPKARELYVNIRNAERKAKRHWYRRIETRTAGVNAACSQVLRSSCQDNSSAIAA